MILFFGKKKFLKYLQDENLKIDKEYTDKLEKIDSMGFDEETAFMMRKELFWETSGKQEIIRDMINKLL